MVTCPLAPSVPHLISSSCSSPRIFGLGFLQTPPRGDALALLLAFGCANTWREDLHLARSVPCPAHTTRLTGPGPLGEPSTPESLHAGRVRCSGWFGQLPFDAGLPGTGCGPPDSPPPTAVSASRPAAPPPV
jgi:hypothetical protein